MKHLSAGRNLFIFSVDFFSFLIFYLLLAPKILVKKIKNDELVAENYFGGWYLMKAYKDNLGKVSEIKRLRGVNFFSDGEIERFEAYVSSDSGK